MCKPRPTRRIPLLPAFVFALAGLAPAFADPYVERTVPLPNSDTPDVGIGDFNGDGLADIVAVNSYGPFTTECYPIPNPPIACGTGRMLLAVALGQGLGQMAAASTIDAMCAPWTLVTGDFDNDGHDDVVVGNRGARDAFGICNAASLSFYPGNGRGGFGTASHLVTSEQPEDITAGDIDGDGRKEVIVAFGDAGTVQVLRIWPPFGIVPGPTLALGTPVASIALGDLEGDGDLELAATLPAVDGLAILDFINGAPTLRETCGGGRGALADPRGVTIADLSNEGKAEIAVVNRNAIGSTSSFVTVFVRDAGGSYCLPTGVRMTPLSATGSHAAAGDFDGDGVLDLAVTDGLGHVLSLRGDGTGYFSPGSAPTLTSTNAKQIVAADLDQNGGLDLAVSGPTSVAITGTVSELINTAPIASRLVLDMAPAGPSWIGVLGAAAYDVVRGDFTVLHATGGDFTASLEACVANDLPATGVSIPETPDVGKGFWILARPVFPGGPGTYDSGLPGQVGSRDAEIAASPLSCP